MRHRRRGRKLGRNPSHQRALLRNLASALMLTELNDDTGADAPEKFADRIDTLSPATVSGRIVTTLSKAKEVQPLVERCVTIARRALPHQEAADQLEPDVERNSQEWREWRKSERWHEWNQAIAPVVAARRRTLKLLGDKLAVWLLFDLIAPRFEDRDGGYTRVLRLAEPRLGDAGPRAILEFVGEHDRERRAAVAPSFESDAADTDEENVETEAQLEDEAATGDVDAEEDSTADSDETAAEDQSSEDDEKKESSE